MKITKSNDFTNSGTLTVPADDDTGQTKANMESFDGSEQYTSLGTAATFSIKKTFSGSDRFSATYVAISGHNFGEDAGSLELKVKTVSKGTVSFSDGRNHVIVFTFTEVTLVDEIEFIYTKTVSTFKGTVTFIAAGSSFDVPNDGEMAGYNRPWLTRNVRQRTVQNDQAFPVAVQTRTFTRNQQLNINNINRLFVEGTWLVFLDFMIQGHFFIKESDGSVLADNPKSSYLCFTGEGRSPRAHSATRELDNLSVQFQAFTGL